MIYSSLPTTCHHGWGFLEKLVGQIGLLTVYSTMLRHKKQEPEFWHVYKCEFCMSKVKYHITARKPLNLTKVCEAKHKIGEADTKVGELASTPSIGIGNLTGWSSKLDLNIIGIAQNYNSALVPRGQFLVKKEG